MSEVSALRAEAIERIRTVSDSSDDEAIRFQIENRPHSGNGVTARLVVALDAARTHRNQDVLTGSEIGLLIVAALEGDNHENGLLGPDDVVRVMRVGDTVARAIREA